MKVAEIISIIENIAPLEAQADWDASGVQVASFRDEVTHVAVMLDPTPASVAAGLEAGADFVLSHHPFSMKPRFPNRADDYLSVLSLIVGRGAWLYSAHTSLDANPQGPAQWLADELGLSSVEILEPTLSGRGAGGRLEPLYGFGFTGELPQALGYGEFCRSLAAALGRGDWQVCGPEPAEVRRIACCPGSGGGMYAEALAAGADVYITGDVKYHTALEAASAGLRVLDVGHFVLEEEMMRRLAHTLEKTLSLPVSFVPASDPLRGESARVTP